MTEMLMAYLSTLSNCYAPALSDDARLTSVCLSVAYIGPKSRIERPRKTKIYKEVAHVTRDSDTTVKVKKSKVKGQLVGGGGTLWRPPAQLVDTAAGSEFGSACTADITLEECMYRYLQQALGRACELCRRCLAQCRRRTAERSPGIVSVC